MKLVVRTFRPNDGLGALKVLEEAAECQVEYKRYKEMSEGLSGDVCTYYRNRFEDELADVVMACCNLAEKEDIDLQAAIEFCEHKNRARGRYEQRGL